MERFVGSPAVRSWSADYMEEIDRAGRYVVMLLWLRRPRSASELEHLLRVAGYFGRFDGGVHFADLVEIKSRLRQVGTPLAVVRLPGVRESLYLPDTLSFTFEHDAP